MLARLKFKIDGLVNEMLDQLPPEVWSSETTTFLDPAMAGGQFLKEIINRLRDAGHSDDNIAARVFGVAEDIIDLNYARKTAKLIGKYGIGSYDFNYEAEFGMKKFDVVIGNPPFQKEGQGAASLFDIFLRKAYECSSHIVLYITPSSWIKSPTYKNIRHEMISDASWIKFLSEENWSESVIKIDTIAFMLDKYNSGYTCLELKNGDKFDMPVCSNSKFIDGGTQFMTKFILENETSKKIKFLPSKNKPYSKMKVEHNEFENSVKILKNLSVQGNQYGFVSTDEINHDNDSNKWRVVIGYFRTNVVGLIPGDGTIITGSYLYIPFDSKSEAISFRNYLLSDVIQTIVYYTYTSRTADNPQFSFIPMIDINTDISNDDVYDIFNIALEDRILFKMVGKTQF